MTDDHRTGGGKTRTVATAAVLIGLAVAGLVAWPRLFPPETTTMMTAVAAIGDVEETVLATGILKPSRLVAVGAQVSGRVTKVNVVLGETVAKGALVAEIDSVTQVNELRTKKAALADVHAQRDEKQATLVLAEQTLARQRAMAARKAVSQADLESAEATAATTRAQIAALEAQIIEAEVAVSTAEANLGYTRITAPIDGTVLSIVSQEGQTVNAAQSTPTIVILGALDVMTVRAEISEVDVVDVRPGQPLYFTILGDPDHRYEATLASIEPAPESIRNDSSFSDTSTSSSSSSTTSSEAIYYNGIFDVPNEDGRLRTYMTAEVHIVLGRADGVLTIPTAALGARDGDGRYLVRVVEGDGSIAERRVEIGLDDKVTAEVRSGLVAGERVVTGELSAQAAPSSPGGPPMGL